MSGGGKKPTASKVLDLMAALKASLRGAPTSHDFPEDWGYENGDYQCICCHCAVQFRGHKRRVTCKACELPATALPPAPRGPAGGAR